MQDRPMELYDDKLKTFQFVRTCILTVRNRPAVSFSVSQLKSFYFEELRLL